MISPRLVMVVALAAAFVVSVGPSFAFDRATMSRSASAEAVSDAAQYNAITFALSCTVPSTLGGWCQWGTVTNQATVAQTFKVIEEHDPNSKSAEWRIGGGTAVSSGWASSSEVAVGGTASIEMKAPVCVGCIGQSHPVHWQVQGEKANKLNSLQTTLRMQVTYS